MFNSSKWLLIGVLIILAIRIIATGLYTSRKSTLIETEFKKEIEQLKGEIKKIKQELEQIKQKISEEPKEISEIDTSEWKTYRNEEYGFEIKYPKNFTIAEKGNKIEFNFPKAEYQGTQLFDVSITLSFESGFRNGKEELLRKCYGGEPYPSWKVTINNVEFYQDHYGDCGGGRCREYYGYYAIHNGNCYRFRLSTYYCNRPPDPESPSSCGNLPEFNKKELEKTFEKMLFTFKFFSDNF